MTLACRKKKKQLEHGLDVCTEYMHRLALCQSGTNTKKRQQGFYLGHLSFLHL